MQRRGYAVMNDPALARPVERDTVTCNHCQRVVFVHDKAGRALHGVLVHCHQCDANVCVPCAERARCAPFDKRLEQIEARSRLRAKIGDC